MTAGQAVAHVVTDHGRACAAACRAMLKAENDPLGRDWNNQTTQDERRFWLKAAGQAECLARKDWKDMPLITRQALRAAMFKVAARARHLLEGAAP